MKKIWKVVAVFAILGLIAVSVATLAIRHYLPPERLKVLVVNQAQKALGREVSVGAISVDLIHGLLVEKLAVSEKPDFKAGRFAEAESFALRLRLLPLLHKKIEVDKISADGLRLSIIQRPDGTFNFSDMAGPSAAAAKTESPISLVVKKASLRNAQISYKDMSAAREWKLSKLNAKISDLRMDGPFTADLDCIVEGRSAGKPIAASVAFDGKLDLGSGKPERMQALVKQLRIQESGRELRLSGTIQGLPSPKLDVAAHWSFSGTEILSVDVQGTAATLGPHPSADLSLKLRTIGFEPEALQRLGLPVPALPKGLAVPPTSMEGSFHLAGEELSLEKVKVETKIGRLEVSGRVTKLYSDRIEPNLQARLHLDLPQTKAASVPFAKLPEGSIIPATLVDAELVLKSWDATFSVLRLKTSGIQLDAAGTVTDILGQPQSRDLTAKFHLDIPQTQADTVPFMKLPHGLVIPASVVDAAFRLSGKDVLVDSCHLKTQAGQADVKGAILHALSGQPEPNLQVQAKLDLPAWRSEDLPFPEVPAGLAVPASHWEVAAAGGLDNAEFTRLRVILGKNDLEVSGKIKALRSKDPALDVMLKCRSFLLDELTPIAKETRELKLSGSGFFVLGVSGPVSKPILSGKMKFKDIGATVAGLPLSAFTGTASFDENRIDIPNLSGKVADGTLAMDLTVKHYRRQPAIDLEAALDRFDLGRYLAAKQALSATAPAPSAKTSAPVEPFSAKGKFTVGELIHPNMTAKDVKLSWELDGISPGFKTLDGWAKLLVAGGDFSDLGKAAQESVVLKVLTLPLVIIQKIAGGGIHLFPDLNHITFTEIAGDYAFAGGLMTMKDTHLYGDGAFVDANGTVDLPSENLDLMVTAQVGHVAPIAIKVTGTFTKPQTKMQVGQFIKNIFRLPVPASN